MKDLDLVERLHDAGIALFRREGHDLGAMTVSPGGRMDMACVLPEHQGKGVFRPLITEVEIPAQEAKEERL